jgi:mRNA interferase MazF
VGAPAVGDVVLVPFPFSDLSRSKLRPAVVAGLAEFGDVILCQITSRPYASRNTIELDDEQLDDGRLDRTSYIRPDKLFTADSALVVRSLARLKPKMLARVRNHVAANFEGTR